MIRSATTDRGRLRSVGRGPATVVRGFFTDPILRSETEQAIAAMAAALSPTCVLLVALLGRRAGSQR